MVASRTSIRLSLACRRSAYLDRGLPAAMTRPRRVCSSAPKIRAGHPRLSPSVMRSSGCCKPQTNAEASVPAKSSDNNTVRSSSMNQTGISRGRIRLYLRLTGAANGSLTRCVWVGLPWMGTKLHSTFVAAGLRPQAMRLEPGHCGRYEQLGPGPLHDRRRSNPRG
jgi:hypothetical protein